ncbi:MAG: HAD-IC family P-type ATPase [bacterium]|nr:HAD-IC family P-type ATPase [bacterium]
MPSTSHAAPRGLSSTEAEKKLAVHGLNEVAQPPAISQWWRFAAQFNNALVYLLLFSCMATAFMGHWIDTAVIAVVVVVNALIGFVQERKAEMTLAGIRKLVPLTALAVRDGETVRLTANLLVPGDTVIIVAGDRVPADISLRAAHGLKAEESMLTGESLDCEKTADITDKAANLLYSGSLVTTGSGWGEVVATGPETEIGRISGHIANVESPETPLTKRVGVLSRYIVFTVFGVALIAFAFGMLVRGISFEAMVMILIGITVAAVPEGLPAAMSVILATGIGRMARRKAIIRRLPVVETLGNVTVICTDKTGTLTTNELMADQVVTAGGVTAVGGSGYAPEGQFPVRIVAGNPDHSALSSLVHACVLNNDAVIQKQQDGWDMHGDPTEGALLALAGKAGLFKDDVSAVFPRLAVIPFDAEHKYMGTLHRAAEGENRVYMKGAPEAVLHLCGHQMEESGEVCPINRAYWDDAVDGLAKNGRRVLAIAVKKVGSKDSLYQSDLSGGLVLVGLLGIADQARPEARDAIRLCQQAGISVKMITGDHPVTATVIAAEVGLLNASAVLTGAELDSMDDTALAASAIAVNVFARMRPQHKLRLVKALQADGMVVSMTGDGVNDAPALKAADVGIVMGMQGTDVAKEAADIVLTDDNFATIAAAVEEGRNIYKSLRLAIQFMIITDFAEGLSLLASLLLGLPQPITPLQILWVNTVTSITLSMAFAFLPRARDAMSSPPVSAEKGFFDKKSLVIFAVHIGVMTAGTIFTFTQVSAYYGDEALARTAALTTLVSFQVWYFISMYPSCPEQNRSLVRHYAPLAITAGGIFLLQFVLCYFPPMQMTFATRSLSGELWGVILSATSVIALLRRVGARFV